MRRLFGFGKKKEPAPSLDDASKAAESRSGGVDDKIKKLDAELLKYKEQMKKMKPGPAKKNVQQRALRVLKQKKLYEKQKDNLQNQMFNIDQTKFATENIKDSQVMVAAMKAAGKELKTAQKDLDLDEIEDLHDDMSDMLEQSEEINDILGRSYGVPEELDEADLDAELEGLEGEMGYEEEETEASSEKEKEMPDYLVSAASASKNQPLPSAPHNKLKDSDELDDGLPALPAPKAVPVKMKQ